MTDHPVAVDERWYTILRDDADAAIRRELERTPADGPGAHPTTGQPAQPVEPIPLTLARLLRAFAADLGTNDNLDVDARWFAWRIEQQHRRIR